MEAEDEAEEGEEVVVWQGRCLELEDSLARFRDQAHRIREILKEKVRCLNLNLAILPFSRLSFVIAMHCYMALMILTMMLMLLHPLK